MGRQMAVDRFEGGGYHRYVFSQEEVRVMAARKLNIEIEYCQD